jgi:hypothetical protein
MKKNKENELLGVAYPLPKNILDRLFKIKKPIFVKFLPREIGKKSKSKISSMERMYFYESASERRIVGLGKIKKIESFTLSDIPKEYFHSLILNKNELKHYSKGRESKKMVLFHLESIKRFMNPLILIKPITMAGIYLYPEHIESKK